MQSEWKGEGMKKVTLLAAMLAMVMVAAAPALAQSSAVGGSVQVQYQNSPQEINQSANVTQSNTGGGTGAGIAQSVGIDQSASNISAQAGGNIGTTSGSGSGGSSGSASSSGSGATAVGGDVQIQEQYCPQVITQAANADQANTGGGTGAGIAQDLGISQSAVNACLQAGGDINVGGGETVVVEESDPGVHKDHKDHDAHKAHKDDAAHPTSEGASETASAETASAESGGVASAVYAALPDTGGLPLIALGAGVLLVGGGLVARRMFS